ncbi:LysE family translocator [Corynebacterium breve]|uniref:LysE family translocator n=1 Tax=Corynebacterium breve TaxID=3049799 RepID=A0ABY8VGT1_9CORY|nr:LysE family translocator [Corynebacterium breve]WIM67853.1 LysE family translocator [Corynebacterium breve]
MTIASYAALIGVWLAAIISPGPDLFQIIRIGAKSRAAGVACALGIMLGNTLWVVASLLGLSALIRAVPEVLGVLQLVGGAYLIYMGAQSVRAGLASRRSTPSHTIRGPEMSSQKAFGLGFTTNLSNPKAVLFFGAVFAQFVRPDMGWEWMAIIAVTMVVIGIIWFVLFALLVRAIAAPLERYGHIIDIVAGAIFIALGMWMVVEGFQSLIG